MKIRLPELSLVILIGPSGSGKSTFARQHFLPTEVVSSDVCRGLVSDDENNQAATKEAFELVHFTLAQRLKLGKLSVVDATNVQPESRRALLALAREYHVLPVAIVFKTPEQVCHERNLERPDRQFGHGVIRRQISQMRRGLRGLKREGFRYIYSLEDEQQIAQVQIERQRLWNNRHEEQGPLDIVGDVHGCFEELCALMGKMGYCEDAATGVWAHEAGRKLVFVGDLVDRGPGSIRVLELVRQMVEAGQAYCVPGNHDVKFLRWLKGKQVQLTHGLEVTIAELEAMEAASTEEENALRREQLAEFIDGLVSHLVFDGGKLAVAHAGLKESMVGRASGAVREFALYGETTGERDEYGFPVRLNWAADYRGETLVVYGHTPVAQAQWLNHTINLDTGCVFGGELSALRYPEQELVSVPALATYAETQKPFLAQHFAALAEAEGGAVGEIEGEIEGGIEGENASEASPFANASNPANLANPSSPFTAQQRLDEVLDLQDYLGKQIVSTQLLPNITVREENANAALEVMSRFALNPKWLIYLPPTMSPSETSEREGYLEYPSEAFEHYSTRGVKQVICEEKHMGSRAVVVICRDEQVVLERFGIRDEGIGQIFTRTGRAFFPDKEAEMQQALLQRLHAALTEAKFWERHNSDWFCFDCELMPWSWKAKELIRRQYAGTASAARAYHEFGLEKLVQANADLEAVTALKERLQQGQINVQAYTRAYQQYCWSAEKIEDFKLAPFHLLASEGKVHTEQTHHWHMEELHELCRADEELLLATQYRLVNLAQEAELAEACAWWEQMTKAGGEGFVVKPLEFVARGERGLLQPAVKCRGQEYLRIIYGVNYDLPENLQRLRKRGLGRKRSMASREFALGVEALQRFVRKEPLRRVHQCVFAILALESDPVDPRL